MKLSFLINKKLIYHKENSSSQINKLSITKLTFFCETKSRNNCRIKVTSLHNKYFWTKSFWCDETVHWDKKWNRSEMASNFTLKFTTKTKKEDSNKHSNSSLSTTLQQRNIWVYVSIAIKKYRIVSQINILKNCSYNLTKDYYITELANPISCAVGLCEIPI